MECTAAALITRLNAAAPPVHAFHGRMNSAIFLRGFNEYRNRARAMPDEDLVKEGKQLHWLSGDGTCEHNSMRVLRVIENCLEEYRRRHPKC